MDEKHTIHAVDHLRTDALYGKKKHFNAADRKERYNTYIGVSLIVANATIASTLIYVLIPDIYTCNTIVVLIGFIATVLAIVQSFFNYSRTAEHHRMVATKYLHIAKECSRMRAYYLDGALPPDELRKRFENLSREYDQITESTIYLSTNQKDYKKAREGFEGGEERYSPKEYQEE